VDRKELLRRIVLNAICDDYENIDQVILRDARDTAEKLDLTIERTDVVEALKGLIDDGLAKAYLLSPSKPWVTELAGMPSVEVPEEYFKTYFYISKKGMDLHLSDDSWWPFEDREE